MLPCTRASEQPACVAPLRFFYPVRTFPALDFPHPAASLCFCVPCHPILSSPCLATLPYSRMRCQR